MRLNAGLTEHPEHAALIAKIVGQWNAIEDASTHLLSYFVGVNVFSATQLFSPIVASRARLDFLDATGRYFLEGDQDDIAAFVELLSQLRGRLKDRNKYAHAVYGIDDQGQLVIVRRDRQLSKDARALEVVRLADLEAAWLATVSTFNAVLRFHNRLHLSLPQDFLAALQIVWLNQDGATRNSFARRSSDRQASPP